MVQIPRHSDAPFENCRTSIGSVTSVSKYATSGRTVRSTPSLTAALRYVIDLALRIELGKEMKRNKESDQGNNTLKPGGLCT
jgi:hypothetical protein